MPSNPSKLYIKFKPLLPVLGFLLATVLPGGATIIGFGQLGGSNTTVPAALGSNAVTDVNGCVVSNGITPNIALVWDGNWDIHTSAQFTTLEDTTMGGAAWDNEGGIPRAGQLDTGNHTIDFNTDDGFALVLNSFDFGQTPETDGTTVWDITLTDSALNVVWSSMGLSLTNNVVTLSPNFTGEPGEDYKLTFSRVSETYNSNGRHGLDNLSFNQTPLPPPPVSLNWTGAVNAQWNTNSLNWLAGGPVAWSGINVQEANFAAAGPKAIVMPEPITARSLSFNAPGYSVQGEGTLTLVETSVLDTAESATIGVPVTGLAGWKKTGAGTLTLTGDLSISGPGIVNGGTVLFTGTASSFGNGTLRLADGAASRASLRMASTGTVDFPGSVRLASGDGSAASIQQSDGT
ncbi:MAG: Autotransporter-associated beta strand repeat protein, partial [Verrucomicrobiales bacterium]|nr:Autotransporter-associated beta strand repeat protein [Verrucomicrobiales bacterium]